MRASLFEAFPIPMFYLAIHIIISRDLSHVKKSQKGVMQQNSHGMKFLFQHQERTEIMIYEKMKII